MTMKRFLSIILALAMVIALVPATFAEGETTRTYTFSADATGATAGGSVSNVNSFYYNSKQNGWQYININQEAKGLNNVRVYWLQTNDLEIYAAHTNSGYSLTGGVQLALAIEKPSTKAGFYKATVSTSNYDTKADIQFYMGKWDNAKNSVETYITDSAKFNTATYIRKEASHTLDGILYNDGTSDFAFVIDTLGPNLVFLKSLTLDEISPELSLSLDKTVINLNDTATASVNATWTETDGSEKTQKVLNDYVTYESNNEAVAKVSETGEITAVSKGTATITAKVGNESETQTIKVVDLSGISVQYDTYAGSNADGLDAANKIDYTRNNGRIEYLATTSTAKNPYSWDQTAKNDMGESTFRFIAAFVLTANSDEYTAYKIRVPATGDYEASLYYLACANADAARGGSLYILPGSTADIATALKSATPVLSNVNFYNETNQFKTTETVSFTANVAGEYIMVWKNTGDTGTRITPVRLTLNGGTEKAPIWANMAVENAELEVDGTTTLTSTVYTSDGKAATDTAGITYESTNGSVATISGTTVTAVGAGTAKIQAKSGDYVLGEVGVTVSHPKAPTVSFYAESTDNAETPITITAADADGNPVSPATAATLNRGAEVTVNAPEKEGYLFVGWFRGSKDTGRFVWADNEYTFNAMTHTMLTAVYEEATEEAYYNFNGEFLGTTKPSADPTMLGYKFDGWNETVYNNLTRLVANYLKDKAKTYTVTLPSGVSVEKDEDDYYYDTKVTLTSNTDVTWLRNNEPVAYGKTYTFYVWDNVTITTDTEADTEPKVILDSSKSGAYMIEYDAGDKTIVETGIIFGNDGDEVSIESCKEKMNSQRGDARGQFTASSDYTNARGYLIYKDGNDYKVIYAD